MSDIIPNPTAWQRASWIHKTVCRTLHEKNYKSAVLVQKDCVTSYEIC